MLSGYFASTPLEWLIGSPVLAALLQDLTTRTVLIAALYQSSHDACESSGEHEQIIDALEAGDWDRITKLAREAVEGAKQ